MEWFTQVPQAHCSRSKQYSLQGFGSGLNQIETVLRSERRQHRKRLRTASRPKRRPALSNTRLNDDGPRGHPEIYRSFGHL